MSSELEGVEVKCPNCGATLGAATAGAVYTCRYCGHRSATPFAARPAALPPQQAGSGVRRVKASRASFVARYYRVGIALVVLVGALSGFLMAFRGSGSSSSSSSWDPDGPQPVLAEAAGGELVVGRLVHGSDRVLYVGAFDAVTGKKRWKVGPFGTFSQGYRSTDLAVSGSHVVVTDFHATAHIYDLATGKEQRVVALTDRIDGLGSVWPLGKDRVVIKQADERTTILDLSTGSAREAPKSADREPPLQRVKDDNGRELDDLPPIPGFRPERVFKSDRMTVVSGGKSPGIAIPMVVGLEPGAKAPEWKLPIPVVDAATVRVDTGMVTWVADHGDRFVGIYGVGQKVWHMTAIDTGTGTRQWDVTLDEIPTGVDRIHGLLLSSNRVFVVRMQKLELYDAATGKLVATLGGGLFVAAQHGSAPGGCASLLHARRP